MNFIHGFVSTITSDAAGNVAGAFFIGGLCFYSTVLLVCGCIKIYEYMTQW